MTFWILIIVLCAVALHLTEKEKASFTIDNPDQSPLSGRLWWYVFILEILLPIIALEIFYIGWRRVSPLKAKKAVHLGIVALPISMIGFFSLIVWALSEIH